MNGGFTIVTDAVDLAAHAAEHFLTLTNAALEARGRGDVALAGGSTPRAMNELLASAPLRKRLDWSKLRFFFSDERCVPPDHADSNFRMTRETLFDPLGIHPDNVFRMQGELEPTVAAADYDRVLARELGLRPVFDLITLGMGPDGHTASLFPGTIASIDAARCAVANYIPKFAAFRITLTPHAINAAAHVMITAGGAEKAASLAGVLDGPYDPERYPIQLVAPTQGELHWFVDAAAAAQVDHRD